MELFGRYVVENVVNFAGDKNVFLIENEDLPVDMPEDWIADPTLEFPEYLLLTPTPEVNKNDSVSSIMHVMLVDSNGKENHTYNLPFGAIGKIVRKN